MQIKKQLLLLYLKLYTLFNLSAMIVELYKRLLHMFKIMKLKIG